MPDNPKNSAPKVPFEGAGNLGKPGATDLAPKSAQGDSWQKLTSASHDLLQPPRRWTRIFSLLIILAIVVGLVWADRASLEEFTTGVGRVVAARKTQIVQNLEGGIVKQILVKDGQRVKKGQILFRIDTTGTGSDLAQRKEKLTAFRVRSARLLAEVSDQKPVIPKEIAKSHPEFVKLELALYRIRQREISAAIRGLKQRMAQKEEEIRQADSRVNLTRQILAKVSEEIREIRPMVKRNLSPKVDLIRLEQRALELQRDVRVARSDALKAKSEMLEAQQRIQERKSSFKREARDELNKVRVEIATLRQSVKAYQDRVKRAEVRSPVNGIVKEVKVTTIGEVVKPGLPLAEIVPLDDTLLVEADVLPSDIAFLRPGQAASVKITAYDFSIYGSLNAKLEEISADTITDERGERFYRIRVRTRQSYITHNGKKLPIIPGMTAQVDIVTGKKTVLQYLLKPFNKIRQKALREK